jgi:hypothetical protein
VVLGFTLAFAACTSPTSVEHVPTPTAPQGALVKLELVPIPEGVSLSFERHPPGDNMSVRPLGLVRPYIPGAFPPPLDQPEGCTIGGDLVATFADGSKLSYGPCARPESINRLWAATVFEVDGGSCAPACGPNGEPPPQID